MKRSLARVDEPCMSPALKRAKVQAQRKFAQGSSNYSYSSSPPISSKHRDCYGFVSYQNGQLTDSSENDEYEMNSFSSLPTVDDFLTFLCFRETDALPKRLDYLNTPQFDAHVKKKPSKLSNSVRRRNVSHERKNAPPSKINAKPICSIAKKKLSQYTLRSRNLNCKSITTKSSHSLALKHNQRLRSKSVVESKFIENKFQSIKSRNVIATKISPLTSRIRSKVKKVGLNHFKNRPLTRSLNKKTSTVSPEDTDFRRTTRRNSTLHKQLPEPEKSENISQHDKFPKRKVSVSTDTRKTSAKLLQVSIPKFKPSSAIVDRISRTVTRNLSKNSDSMPRNSVSPISTPTATTVNVRPSRKTKEAAALYMEMLGKELLCPDESCEDDDNISLDSFPELPNAVEHIRREKELKEMHQKKMVEQTRRNSVPKHKATANASTESERSNKDAFKEKIAAVTPKKEVKKNCEGLCTRSKQYDVESFASTPREQSVKIIRTRTKNDRFANMNRRNSYNDIFNRFKNANENFKGFEMKSSKKSDTNCKANNSVTIKKLLNDKLKCSDEKHIGKAKSNEDKIGTTPDVSETRQSDVINVKKEERENIDKKTEVSVLSTCGEKTNANEAIKDGNKKNKFRKEHAIGSPVIIERISTKKNIDSKLTNTLKIKNEKVIKSKIGLATGSKESRKMSNIIKVETSSNQSASKTMEKKNISNEQPTKPSKHETIKGNGSKSDEKNSETTTETNKSADVRGTSVNDTDTTTDTKVKVENIVAKPCEEIQAKKKNILVSSDRESRSSSRTAESNVKKSDAKKFVKEETPESKKSELERVKSIGKVEISKEKKSTNSVVDENVKSRDDNNKVEEVRDEPKPSEPKKCTSNAVMSNSRKTSTQLKTIESNTKTTNDDKPDAPTVNKSERKKIIFKKNSSPSPNRKKEETVSRKSDAFSPDNEKSVYAFEPDLPTTSPPFRRLKPITPPKSIAGSSIAVQVNFKNGAKLECSNSVETQVSSTNESGDRVFYIPIQTSDSTSTLGVALKLDTDGPNQKIIMSATLITDSTTLTTNTCTSVSATSSKKTLAGCSSGGKGTKLSGLDGITKSTSSGVTDKVVASTNAHSAPSISYDTAPTTAKVLRKTSPIKANQSVKIVKLNKNKKSKLKMTENSKTKSSPSPKSKIKKKLFADNATATGSNKHSDKTKGEILDAPTFYPSADEFNDPLEYIEKIRNVAEKYGLCRIVPPANFKPECKVADEMRFTAYNQYVHKMLHRWGPNVKELMAIKKFLLTQNITLNQSPLIGGMEVDLPLLYQVVQQCGGLNAVIEKERWHQVADIMKIPKLAQDRITKLDDIYCKYLLPYDVLSHDERENLLKEIEKEWASHLQKPIEEDIFEDVDECIIKGRTMPLSCFYRIARNTMLMRFGNIEGQDGPTSEKIEEEFWNHVSHRKCHVCVHSGSIDSGSQGYGFSVDKKSTCKKHPWNLKVLTNNQASILRSLGPIMGVTVPTLHVSMLYSACCWYRDPHGLPWIEYLHTGADKIWYGIPDKQSERFKDAMSLVVPRYCRNEKIWLPSDTVMIPPPLLTEKSVSLSRVVQHPGQFIVVFPKSFTSSISTGYLVSESVYFAQTSWLNSAKQIFEDMQNSCEPSIFSLEQLLICIAEDTRTCISTLNKILPLLVDLRDTEMALRHQLKELGIDAIEKSSTNKKRKSKGAFNNDDDYECESCRMILFVSQVINSNDLGSYCLKHAVSLLLKKPSQTKHCQLSYSYSEDELDKLIDKVTTRIGSKNKKNVKM